MYNEHQCGGGKGVVWRVYKPKSTSQYRNLRVDFDIGLSILVVLFSNSLCSTSPYRTQDTGAKGSMSAVLLQSITTLLILLMFLSDGLLFVSDSLLFVIQPLSTQLMKCRTLVQKASWMPSAPTYSIFCLTLPLLWIPPSSLEFNTRQMPINIDKCSGFFFFITHHRG
jgi:hypothetical protein